jgi:Right handed beta helix region
MTPNQFVRLFAATLAITVLACTAPVTGHALAAPTSTIVVDDGFDTVSCAAGSYSLRCAITYANANPGTSIRFAPGLPAVLLDNPLPTITADYTWIDGHDIVNNGCYCPRIDGSFMTAGNGLTINASFVTISNIRIVNIPGLADISIEGGKDNEISYNYLGILPGATQCSGNTQALYGVEVVSDHAGADTAYNGAAYIFENTLSCHGANGVEVVDSNYVYVGKKRDLTASGNYIGTTSDGVGAAGNGYAGVVVTANSNSVYIGGNRIAHNASAGVVFVDGTGMTVFNNTLSANGKGVVIYGGGLKSIILNRIGTTPDGLLPWPNTREGILVTGGTYVGIHDNLIAYNGAAGVAVTGNSTHAGVEDNDIYGNGGLPIDLGNDGATPNGSHGAVGPNNWHAYPVVTAFSGSLVQGTTCADCSVLIFKASGNPAGRGGGGVYLLSAVANGFGQWSATLPSGLTRLDVTFMGLDASYENNSEMSPRPQLLLPLIRR